MEDARIICTDLAGLRNQALGLTEAARLHAEIRPLRFRPLGEEVPTPFWFNPRWAVAAEAFARAAAARGAGVGGAGCRVAAALRGPGVAAVAVQHPRMALEKFDLVFAARHDGIVGANVIVTRTALHRVTAARLEAERAAWAAHFAPYRRPLVAVLLGGSNGRYRFEAAQAHALAAQLALWRARPGWRSRPRAGPRRR